jgi:hypothetical protein
MVLQIVGKLIANYGPNWREDIPDVLRRDMKSLQDNVTTTGKQPLNLQQRVIQSGNAP